MTDPSTVDELATRTRERDEARAVALHVANERDRALKLAEAATVTGGAAASAAEASMEALKKDRARIADLEAKLTMLADANRALTSENNAAERDLRICRLNEQLLDRVIDLVGKDPVDGIQKMEEHIAELERELAAARRSGTEDNELWELRGAELRSARARIAELERERDEGRRELRASEWVARWRWRSSVGSTIGHDGDNFYAVYHQPPHSKVYEAATWSKLATDLGWKDDDGH